jgi:metal-dependent HD superfamily phosphatase/phosphodiesterase
MNESKGAVTPLRFECGESGVKPEEAVEVNYRAVAAGTRDRERRPRVVVIRLAVRHDHAQAIHRAAHEHHHQPFAA